MLEAVTVLGWDTSMGDHLTLSSRGRVQAYHSGGGFGVGSPKIDWISRLAAKKRKKAWSPGETSKAGGWRDRAYRTREKPRGK